MQQVILKNLGKISYQKAWDLQQELLSEVIGIKRENREKEINKTPQKHYFGTNCRLPYS